MIEPMKRKPPTNERPEQSGRSAARGPSYWLLEPSTPEDIVLRAQVRLEANPSRAGANDWRQARQFAQFAQAATENSDVQGAVFAAMAALRFAMRAELLEGPAPIVARDMKRQSGTKKPRRPDIDAWLDKALAADSDAKAPALWSKAPDWITDQIGADSFKKRVTKARSRRK